MNLFNEVIISKLLFHTTSLLLKNLTETYESLLEAEPSSLEEANKNYNKVSENLQSTWEQ